MHAGIATLKTMYDCFNARDIDGVLAALAEDVEWANGMDGGHVQGQTAVREYWTEQWAQISPRVEPIRFDPSDDGEIAVQVRQELFDLLGKPLKVAGGLHSQIVRHIFHLDAGKVTRFDIDHETQRDDLTRDG